MKYVFAFIILFPLVFLLLSTMDATFNIGAGPLFNSTLSIATTSAILLTLAQSKDIND